MQQGSDWEGPSRRQAALEAGRSPEPGPSEAGDWELRLGFRLQHRRVLNPFEGRAEETGGDSVRCFSYTEGARPFPAEDRGLLSGLVPCCWETGAAPQRLPMDLRSSHRSPVQSEWLKSKGEQGTKVTSDKEFVNGNPNTNNRRQSADAANPSNTDKMLEEVSRPGSSDGSVQLTFQDEPICRTNVYIYNTIHGGLVGEWAESRHAGNGRDVVQGSIDGGGREASFFDEGGHLLHSGMKSLTLTADVAETEELREVTGWEQI
ncbi:uncharacterized protein [Mobula birostris]|uniref:uncharacterized protein n=1 Tax=Mobula birostris TaxID=1983395 RepID=UPI003B28309C